MIQLMFGSFNRGFSRPGDCCHLFGYIVFRRARIVIQLTFGRGSVGQVTVVTYIWLHYV